MQGKVSSQNWKKTCFGKFYLSQPRCQPQQNYVLKLIMIYDHGEFMSLEFKNIMLLVCLMCTNFNSIHWYPFVRPVTKFYFSFSREVNQQMLRHSDREVLQRGWTVAKRWVYLLLLWKWSQTRMHRDCLPTIVLWSTVEDQTKMLSCLSRYHSTRWGQL